VLCYTIPFELFWQAGVTALGMTGVNSKMMIIVDIQRDKQFPNMHSLALPTSCATFFFECLSLCLCAYVV
jgi:hypothetical protein